MSKVDDFLLTDKTTVGELKRWIKNKDDDAKVHIIKLIDHRFTNRYLKHVRKIDSGFLKMAVSCLMVETFESFRQGLKNTKKQGEGERMFKDFFLKEKVLFPGFSDISKEFYQSIRCGILHQAETTKGWRILRKGRILDKTARTINATRFVSALEKSLVGYVNSLTIADFSSTLWKNAILKLEDVCENCKKQP